MRKILLVLFLAAILILDYAALDDITTGNEPDFIGEYLILIISGLVFVGVVLALVLFKNKKK